jgi:phosphate transport system protein
MRTDFHAELADVRALLVAMAEAVRTAMRRATTALLDADSVLAEDVISGDATVNALYQELDDKLYGLLAQQAPVARDLRQILVAMRMGGEFERMGDLAKHVAKSALRRHPAPAVPAELAGIIRDMAGVADRISGKVGAILATPSAAAAAELESDDDAMDELHRALHAVLVDASWPHGVESAIDGALLGRFYERFADHAVNAGRHMYFLVTGESLTNPPGAPWMPSARFS